MIDDEVSAIEIEVYESDGNLNCWPCIARLKFYWKRLATLHIKLKCINVMHLYVTMFEGGSTTPTYYIRLEPLVSYLL